MRKSTILTLFCIMCAVSAPIKAQTKSDTLIVSTTPRMHCQNCETKIMKNIRFVKGTKNIKTSVPDQTVTIVYDGTKTRYEDYAAAFRKIGFEIRKTNRQK